MTDDGALVKPLRKPSFGARAVVRQWENAKKKLAGATVSADIVTLSGEAAIIVRLAEKTLSIIHVETRNALIAALRVNRDPERLARLRDLHF